MKSIITALLLFISVALAAQYNNLYFDQITDDSGRSLGFITGLEQDQNGFMWISTRSGLYRYDGYDYKLFRHNSKDSLSLPYNDITYMYLDSENRIWLRHYDQFSVFQNEQHSTEFKNLDDIHFDLEAKVVEDKDGNIWIGPSEKGLMKIETKTGEIMFYKKQPPMYSPKAISLVDSLIINNSPTALLNKIGNNADTSMIFNVKQKQHFVIISCGESDANSLYDYGALEKNNSKVWEMKPKQCKTAGGSLKNKLIIKPIVLQSGNYKLHYISDDSHSFEAFTGNAPDLISLYGIGIYAISENEFNLIQKTLKPFQPKNSLISNQIKDLLIDKNGQLCVLHDKGIECYNKKSKTFIFTPINYSELLGVDDSFSYLKFYLDTKNCFWIGTLYGLIKTNQQGNKLIIYQNRETNEVLTSNSIYSISEEKNGAIWIGTDEGLNILPSNAKHFIKIKADNKNRLYDNRILKVFEDRSSILWIATFEGLNRLKKSLFTYTNTNTEKYGGFIARFNKKGNLWFHKSENEFLEYNFNSDTSYSIKLNKDIFPLSEYFNEPEYQISDFQLVDASNALLAIDNKVYKYNFRTNKYKQIIYANAVIIGEDSIKNQVKRIVKASSGNYWIFTLDNVIEYSYLAKKKVSVIPYNFKIRSIYEIMRNPISDIINNNNGIMYVRTYQGIYWLNVIKKTFTSIFAFDEEIQNTSLINGNLDLYKNKQLWFATFPSVYKISITTNKIDTFYIENEIDVGLSSVLVQNDSIVWIYTNNGLFKLNTKTNNTDFITNSDGLADNNIIDTYLDLQSNLWLTSPKGLTKFDIAENKGVTFFSSTDYVSHQFIGNHYTFQQPKPKIIFFTSNGFISFFPDSINNTEPKIAITKISLFGKEYKLDSLIYHKKELLLNYDQNFIAFDFSSLDFTDPIKNQYIYYLENLDKDWTLTDASNRKATYTSIPPGEYIFHLNGSNNDKVWNSTEIKLRIIIKPPWWATITAYILYGITIIVSLFLFIRIRERSLQREKQILEQKVKERTEEVVQQNVEITKQRDEIVDQKKNITDSIHYASRIQTALLPSDIIVNELLNDYFILFKPRDIVSGDFYWMTQKDDEIIFIAADCTGHGVPGAFMSLLGISFLNEIVNKNDEHIQANEILNKLRAQVISSLSQTGEQGSSKDGMDLSLCVINTKTNKLQFAGAYNSLFLIRNNELLVIKADRMPIGFYFKGDTPFKNNDYQLQKDDILYMFSDGYADQFGGKTGKKYMSKNFKQFLLDNHTKSMEEQKQALEDEHNSWRGKTEQVDDIIVVGIKM